MKSTSKVSFQKLSPLWPPFSTTPETFCVFVFKDGLLYLFGNAGVSVLDAPTGLVVKHKSVDWMPWGILPVFAGSDIYISCALDGIVRLNRTLTEPPSNYWKGGNDWCNAAVDADCLYLTCWDDQHDDLAMIPLASPAAGWSVATGGGIGNPATVKEGSIYVGLTNGGVLALDAVAGNIRWHNNDPPRVSSYGTCILEDSTVFLAAETKSAKKSLAYAIGAQDGRTIWSRQFDETLMTFLTVLDEFVYCCGRNTCYALKRQNGDVAFSLSGLPAIPFRSHVIPSAGRLYICAGEFVVSIDPHTLQEIERYSFNDADVVLFSIHDSILYVATGDIENGATSLGAYAL